MGSNAKLLRDVIWLRDVMTEVATGRKQIQEINEEYVTRKSRLKKRLADIGIADPNGFTDLWAWYGRWKDGSLPSYQSRRQYLQELFAPVVEKLEAIQVKPGPLRKATGWTNVDRVIESAREKLPLAKHEEEYQGIGLLCREALISVSQAVFRPEIHKSRDGKDIGNSDVKRMLESFFDTELQGGSNDECRRHARASLDLANHLVHKRTANGRDAALCLEATTSVTNIVAIVSGRFAFP